MKKFISCILKISLLLLLASCSQINSPADEGSEGQNQSAKSGFCTFKLALSQDAFPRVVYPGDYDLSSLYYKFSYLDSNADNTNYPEDGSGATYAQITGKSFTLATGSYLFALDAYSDSACSKKILKCTENVTLSPASSSVTLKLKSTTTDDDATAAGSVSVKLNIPSASTVTKVTAKLVSIEALDAAVDTKELTPILSTTSKSVTYENSGLATGSYILYFTLSGDGIEPTVIPELVIVATGQQSSNAASPIEVSEDHVNTNIIYVSSTGSSFGIGTKSNPFATIDAAVSLINSKSKTETDWAIIVDGTLNCLSTVEISSEVKAKSLTLMGVTSTSVDGLRGNGSHTTLALENTIPVTIKNLFISNGGMGGISIKGSGKVEITGSAITGCDKSGIRITSLSSSDVEIKECLIGGEGTDINAGITGGGIFKEGVGNLVISDSTIKGNVASDSGGAIWTSSAITLKDHVVITENTAINYGGGIFCADNEDKPYTITLENSTVSKNTVTLFSASQNWLGFGGGIFIAKAAGLLMKGDSLISQNISSRGGAGVRMNEASSSFEMQGGSISENEAGGDGGGLNIGGGSFIMSGGSISGNKASGNGGAVAHCRDTAGQSSFTISGSASIPAGSEGKNDVYMNAVNPITVASALSAESPVLKITPAEYEEGKVLLALAAGADSSLKGEFKKFALKSTSSGGKTWYIDTKGFLKEVKAIADEYISVTGSHFDGSAILADSQVFIEGRALTIPNLIVGVTELSQAAYEAYCKYGKESTNANTPPNSNYDTGSAAPIYPAYGIAFYDMVVYCNLRSMAEGLTPVYSLGGEKDPRDWDGIVGSEGEKYCGPSAVNSDWDGITFDTSANGWRLPTEAEWEYLARGGNLSAAGQTLYSGSDNAGEVGWYSGENNNKPTAIKQKAANGLGLYDMSGNVFELCWDWSDTITASTLATGAASGTRRIVRGGGCTYTSTSAGVAHRGVDNTPEMRWANCGVRLVRNAD